jgi:hypothetical protein
MRLTTLTLTDPERRAIAEALHIAACRLDAQGATDDDLIAICALKSRVLGDLPDKEPTR